MTIIFLGSGESVRYKTNLIVDINLPNNYLVNLAVAPDSIVTVEDHELKKTFLNTI